jgi:Lar family restriction alleviation protein
MGNDTKQDLSESELIAWAEILIDHAPMSTPAFEAQAESFIAMCKAHPDYWETRDKMLAKVLKESPGFLRSAPKPALSKDGVATKTTYDLRSDTHVPLPELLPCPFCGSTDLTLDNLTDVDDFCVECDGCQIQQIANYTRDEAIRRWNRRVK